MMINLLKTKIFENLKNSRIIHIKSYKYSIDCPDNYFRSSIMVIPFFGDFINGLKELFTYHNKVT